MVMSKINTFMSVARSTKTQKALNLNAAHGLLSRGSSVAEAVTILRGNAASHCGKRIVICKARVDSAVRNGEEIKESEA
jgi:hypothetical protein